MVGEARHGEQSHRLMVQAVRKNSQPSPLGLPMEGPLEIVQTMTSG